MAQNKKTFHSPRKAGLLSTFLPGAGQFYNKKYWKIPIIYGLGATCAYFITDNQRQYKKYRDAIVFRLDDNPETIDEFVNIYPETEQLRVRREFYRRNRDYSIIFTAILYSLNIVDAIVDAHLLNFNLKDDVEISLLPYNPYGNVAGVSILVRFK
jgi:hypothetical protein